MKNNMLTGQDFENMGKAAAKAYVEGNKNLNSSIVKIAETYGLNPEQTARVVEQANIDTYLRLNKVSEDKYIEFPTASIEKVSELLKFDINKTDFFNLESGVKNEGLQKAAWLSKEMTKEAESENKYNYKIEKEFLKKIASALEEVDELFKREEENLYKLVKQAALELEGFYMIKTAMQKSSNDPLVNILVKTYENKLKKEAEARVSFEEIPVEGVLNKEHPILKSLEKMSYYTKAYQGIEKLADKNYEYLIKSLKYSEGKVNELADVVKGLFSFIKKHPVLTLGTGAGIAGTSFIVNDSKKNNANILYNPEDFNRAMELKVNV